jgi:hypothetical protein
MQVMEEMPEDLGKTLMDHAITLQVVVQVVVVV